MLDPVTLKPGLYTESTDRSALGRWKDGSNVRFFMANPEKVKGWIKLISTPFIGVCRAIMAWTTLSASRFIALGTSAKLYLSDANNLFDITPLSSSGTLGANPFTTTLASAVVTVAHTSHGRSVGDYVDFSGATSVGGITPNGSFPVSVVVDTDHYQFAFTSNATSGATGGGSSVAYLYEIPVGPIDTILGTGWGTGGWGIGTWGISAAASAIQAARVWSLAQWGEDLLASPQGKPIYHWSPSSGTNTRAAIITQAPAQNRRILVSDKLRIAISYGSHDGTDPDPMLIRWCDSEDYTEWTPDITNLAGDIRLGQGSGIITAIATRGEIAIFTDQAVYSQTTTGDDLVFSFDAKGKTAGLMGPNAAVDVNGVTYAMGLSKFYTYDGQVLDLDCDVHSRVFGEPDAPLVNMVQCNKVFAAWNQRKSEVVWFFPGTGSNEIDRCVGVNTEDKSWWLGTVHCTSWLDQHPFPDSFTVPLGTTIGPDGQNYIYKQETGVDADGVALPYFLESYDMEIGARSNGLTGAATGPGEFVWKVHRIFIDTIRLVGTHLLTLKGRKTPTDRQWVKGPKRFSAASRHVDIHFRSRQISLRFESEELGADISVGAWRLDADDDGNK